MEGAWDDSLAPVVQMQQNVGYHTSPTVFYLPTTQDYCFVYVPILFLFTMTNKYGIEGRKKVGKLGES